MRWGWIGPALLLMGAVELAPGFVAAQETPRAEPPAEEGTSEDEADLWAQVLALYEKAKAAGEQVPASTLEWVREDLGRIGDWEYRVISLGGSPERIEQQLNELGAERWECFWVQGEGAATRFFLKRPARSYLSRIPTTQLLRLLPVGGAPGDAQ